MPKQFSTPQRIHIRFSVFFLASLLTVISSCQHKGNTSQVATGDSVQVEVEVQLPSLESGEVFLKDQNPFGDDVLLTSEQVIEPDTFIFKPKEPRLLQKDSLLFMKSYGGPFYVFRYPELTYVRTLGLRGNGPGEFIFPDLVASNDSSAYCYLFEIANEKLYKVDKQLQVTPLNFPFHDKAEFASEKAGNIINMGPEDFIFADKAKTGKAIYRIQKQNDSIVTHQLYNLGLFANRKSPYSYIGSLRVNAKQNRMVYAYKYFKIIKFMDLEGKTVRTLNYQQTGFDDQSLNIADGMDSNITYYMQVLPTQKHVYITYSGRTPYDVGKDNSKKNYYMFVEQYDWNGNPIARYRLDQFTTCLTVDENEHRMLGVIYYADDPFHWFRLP